MARVLGEEDAPRVTICHFIWMANHLHILVKCHSPNDLKLFYEQLMKRTTDSLKALWGVEQLSLWERRPSVIRICDFEEAIERIIYFYTNPAKASLVSSIDEFPGLSSWNFFLSSTTAGEEKARLSAPWCSASLLPRAPRFDLSEGQDLFLEQLFKERACDTHILVVESNGWFECFGEFTPEEMTETNREIIEAVRQFESKKSLEHKAAGVVPIGRKRLLKERLYEDHVPAQRGRQILFLASTREIRRKFALEFRAFSGQCAECFQQWQHGDFSVVWPEGAFRPWLPPEIIHADS